MVDSVTWKLGGAGVDGGVVVVAVVVEEDVAGGLCAVLEGVGGGSVSVVVCVPVPCLCACVVVDEVVAVVVDSVADLRCGGVDEVGCVVAIRVVGDVVGGLWSGVEGCGGVAEAVCVVVCKPGGCGGTVVDCVVAVVVDPVADLSGAGVGGWGSVVAVCVI